MAAAAQGDGLATAQGDGLAAALRRSGRRIASLFLHGGCDMACTFCGAAAGIDTLSRADAETLVRALREAGFRSVVLGGGEPLAWPHDAFALAAHARRLGHLVQVSTNGVALPRGFAEDPRVDRFLLPLESTEPAVHDALRAGPGGSHHALVLDRLDALARAARAGRAAREVTVTTVACRANASGLADLGAWLAERAARGLRVHAWHVYRFVPAGAAGAAAARHVLAREEWLAARRVAHAAAGAFPVYVRRDVRRSRHVEYIWREGGALRLGSAAAWGG